MAIGSYIGLSYHLVQSGRVSLGALVQTINVYKDLGDRFSTLLSGARAKKHLRRLGLADIPPPGVEELSKGVSPLSALVFQFNLQTDSWNSWGTLGKRWQHGKTKVRKMPLEMLFQFEVPKKKLLRPFGQVGTDQFETIETMNIFHLTN